MILSYDVTVFLPLILSCTIFDEMILKSVKTILWPTISDFLGFFSLKIKMFVLFCFQPKFVGIFSLNKFCGCLGVFERIRTI